MRSRNTKTRLAHTVRRGNIIIFVVAVLAIISISAASYVTMSSLGRSSAASYQDRRNELLQRDVVIDHIGDLLAADLFGNKVVNVGTPTETSLSNGSAKVRPRAFEDGEFSDIPYTVTFNGTNLNDASVFFTFDTRPLDANGNPDPLYAEEDDPFTLPTASQSRPETPITGSGGLQDLLFHAAFADDAWLASSEPVDDNDVNDLDPGYWDTWPQISNLRSGYYWDQTADNGRGLWVRDTGRFVDLGNFFLTDYSENLDHGDPGAVMTNLSAELNPSLGTYTNDAHEDELHMALHPGLARLQPVFQYQMHQMDEYLDPVVSSSSDFIERTPDSSPGAQYTHADTRMWMDTDGDLRPDARWQELEAFNNLFGWRWFVAARIVDASAMVNANTSLGTGDPADVLEYADGITPADIDIYRLLDGGAFIQNTDPANWSMIAHPDLQITNNNAPRDRWAKWSAQNHIQRGLRFWNFEDNSRPTVLGAMNVDAVKPDRNSMNEFGRFYQARTGLSAAGTIFFPPAEYPYPSFLPLQREAYYRLASSDVNEPDTPNVRFYRDESEIDLRAFWGFSNDGGTAPIEAAFDSTFYDILPAKRTPQADTRYGDPRYWQGLLRSSEEGIAVRKFEEDPGLINWLAGDYTQEEKIKRLMGDTRRHLTTYSGEAMRSPLPLSSTSSLRDGRMQVNDLDSVSTQEYVQNAFSSFMWALAPLAGDHALLPSLIPNNRNNGVINYPYNTHKAHYGGHDTDNLSPAAQWLQDLPDAIHTATLGDDAGVAFAMLRSMSLAVNLRDAVDNDGGTASSPNPSSHIGERPTLARLFLNKTIVPQDGADPVRKARAEITTELAHGTINAGSNAIMSDITLQDALFGNFGVANGITVVGLEPQPFLVEAVSVAFYETPDQTLDDGDKAGFLLAFELGNPWPFMIDAANYTVEVEGIGEIQLSQIHNNTSGALASFTQTSEIQPEETKIFFVVGDYNASNSTPWQKFSNELMLEIQSIAGVSEFTLLDETAASFAAGPNDIPWIGSSPRRVLLWREAQPETTGSDPRPAVPRVLADRLTSTNLSEFPAGFDEGAIDLTSAGVVPLNLDNIARLAIVSSLKRPDEQVLGDGFPQYVFENPDWNHNEPQYSIGDIDDGEDIFQIESDANGLPDTSLLASDVVFGGSVEWTLGEGASNPNDSAAFIANAAPFQLFVPNGPLLTRSELLRISPYAHTYFHPDTTDFMNTVNQWWTFSEQIGSPHAFAHGDLTVPTQMSPYTGLLDPTRFVLGTVATGADLAFDSFPAGNADNHIEDNRFPTDTPTLTELFRGPLNHFAVPLALRVVDAFEVLGTNGDLAHGRININTAGEPVLRVLPHVDPISNYNGVYTANSPTPPTSFAFTTKIDGERRVRTLQTYRDPLMDNRMATGAAPTDYDAIEWKWNFVNTDIMAAPHELTGGTPGTPTIPGIRGGELSGMPDDVVGGGLPPDRDHQTHGFSSLGELAILGQWDTAGAYPIPDVASPGFMDAATDFANQNQSSRDEIFRLRRPDGNFPDFDPIDDAHERMLGFQAISNIVSTRSDVYVAWFVVRAYAPADIESVEIDASVGDPLERVRRGMDGGIDSVTGEFIPGLTPRHESRWLVVFDRSNVKSPTDRPQIVLTAKLPNSLP